MCGTSATIEVVDLQFKYLSILLRTVELQSVAKDSLFLRDRDVNGSLAVRGNAELNSLLIEGERLPREFFELLQFRRRRSQVRVSQLARQIADFRFPNAVGGRLPVHFV